MKKVLLLFAAILMASTGMWAETVDYLYPVYNTDGVPTSGIKEWKTGSVDATIVTDASEPVTWTAGWYVVTGEDVTLSQGAICSGNVHLILADGAMLTATGIDDITNSTPGIQVSGDGNSLTIYGQTAQTGILKATGKTYSAGIGGISTNGLRDGSNITINGGTITADGGSQAAAIGGGLRGNGSNITINGGTVTARGSAAGIGGGCYGNGTNITINGGTVTARGGDGSDGIGNGENATTPSSDIFVVTWCIVKAGSSKTPTDVIENTGSDLATSLAGKQNVTVETPKFAVTYGDNITVSPAFASGAEIAAGTQITFTAADRTADSYGFWGFYEESTFDTPITTGVNGQAYTVMVTDAAISVYARYEKYASASYVYPVYNDPYDVTQGVKEDWGTETVNAYIVTSSATPVTWGEAGKTTWYVVTGEDVQLSQGAICAGKVNLILADGAKLTATGIADYTDYPNYIYTPGIQVSGAGNSLAIYGQTAQSGQLEAIGRDFVAGIGGGEGCSGSNITINGGTVTATSMSGAGIGGGYLGSGSYITINGGTVTARGQDGAGIGGGGNGSGSYITINGGMVTATSYFGAGIGGGYSKEGFNITINGGRVTATGGVNEKNGVKYGDAIGSGFNSSASSYIFVAKNLLVKAGNTEETMYVIGNYTNLNLASGFAGKRFATIEPEPAPEEKEVTYIDENGEEQKVKANVVLSRSFPVTWGEANKTTWYAVTHADVQLISPVCQGDVRLIFADGAKLTANGLDDKAGIQISGDDNSLTIYGQAAQSGQLIATGGELHAGIGGGDLGSGSNITINGGTVTANGGERAAGIGGGDLGSGSNITINGGTVTATGTFGAGIGGGFGGSGSHITINGGIVTATSTYGAGIGGGNDANGSNITINGGIVTATNKGRGAGIGGGYLGSGSDITINGGMVTATSTYGAGIGGGDNGSGSYITINGGTVTANGGENASGIGKGENGTDKGSIFVATTLIVKAGSTENPTDVIANNVVDLVFRLAGKQYVTITEPYFNITANQDHDHKTHYYSTFYSRTCDYQVPSDVTAYTGAVDGDVLKLTAITGGIIPAGEAVILRLTTENNTATKQQFDLAATTTTATKSDTNALTGTDVAKTLGANDYALSLGQNGVGFYLWEGKAIGANKAYLTLESPTMAKAFTFMFDDGETTAIEQPAINGKKSGDTYNLNGVRVNDNYKGIVIKNGKKVYQK